MIDLSGQKIGRLTVVAQHGRNNDKRILWFCICDCGKEKIILGNNLRSGNTKSCGCLKKEGNNLKHGHYRQGQMTKTYQSWHHMIQRCTNPNNKDYNHYGGRDIIVYEHWMKFQNFLEDMGEAPNGYQIDRIDNDGNYCKANCHWATSKQNNRNRRNNRLITHKGKTQCIAAWAEELNIKVAILDSRINKLGWPIEKALTTPIRKKKNNL